MKRNTQVVSKTALNHSLAHPFAAHEVALQSMIRLQPFADVSDVEKANELIVNAYDAALAAATGFARRLNLKPSAEWGCEAVHELFCQLRPHAAKGYHPNRPLFPYIYSALWYVTLGLARKQRRLAGLPLTFDLTSGDSDPAQLAEIHEVTELLATLPEGLRQVVELRYVQGFSSKQAAQLLSVTPNAIDIRTHRARQWLASLLQ